MAKFTRRPKNHREARQLEFRDSDPSGEELQPRVSEVTNDTFLRARRTNHNQNWIKATGMEITDSFIHHGGEQKINDECKV